ncbi:hypothetical protein [Gallaecimonas sp. GXIMD4217]|uniref:hypothetical protein n=1 Tax=Gallaecimonas sp. GXIMD4217 TaxID=3131927 RepID=UPI00311AF13F
MVNFMRVAVMFKLLPLMFLSSMVSAHGRHYGWQSHTVFYSENNGVTLSISQLLPSTHNTYELEIARGSICQDLNGSDFHIKEGVDESRLHYRQLITNVAIKKFCKPKENISTVDFKLVYYGDGVKPFSWQGREEPVFSSYEDSSVMMLSLENQIRLNFHNGSSEDKVYVIKVFSNGAFKSKDKVVISSRSDADVMLEKALSDDFVRIYDFNSGVEIKPLE